MKSRKQDMVQRGHSFAIVDEVDSILVDEARTPLIISGPVEDRSHLYMEIDALMPDLVEGRLRDRRKAALGLADRKRQCPHRGVAASKGLIEDGTLYDVANVTVVHHIGQALKAHKLFLKDRDYIVKNDQVIIIDEFTGRMMQGRRYSEGLHQALEAKEKVEIQPENQTLAQITFQNYFRLYDKLAGMTGTAMTEAQEFMDIYNLDVIEVPTNVNVARVDDDDAVYRTAKEKYRAIFQLIVESRRRGQPTLVGTASIEKSELISEMLKDRKYIRELGQSFIDEANGVIRDEPDGEGDGQTQAAEDRARTQGLPDRHRQSSDRAGRRQRRWRSGSTSGLECPVPRAGGWHHRPGRCAGRHHDRDQHGGPWHRYPARRQPRYAAEGMAARAGRGRQRTYRRRDARPKKHGSPRRSTKRRRVAIEAGGLVRDRHRAPRKPPHRQPAARPLRPSG